MSKTTGGRKIYEVKKPIKKVKAENSGQPWAIKDIDFIEENKDRMTYEEMAKTLGRTRDAVRTFAIKSNLHTRKYYFWSEDETEILKKYRFSGVKAIREELSKNGFNRSQFSIYYRLSREKTVSFDEISNLPQKQFFNALDDLFYYKTGSKLTYKKLSDICYVSYSRVQKWFASGSAQQPLSMQLKHYFWLAVLNVGQKEGKSNEK